jgi:hypothetical protein
MKSSVVFATLCAALFLTSCQENKEDVRNPLSQKDFYKTIGEAIPFETGMEWIDNYRHQVSGGGRTEGLLGYSVSRYEMNVLLSSIEDPVGVSFHYGTDLLGITHIVIIPVDASMSLWSSIPGRIFVDANTGAEIPQSVASSWAAAYRNAHPNDIWFHFFGKNIFDDIEALPYFDEIDIERGTNTVELTPELLLVIWNNTLNLGLGRTMDQHATVYDASNACPPCAVR